MKNVIFFGLIRYWFPIYVLCVSSHFWPFTKANLVLENSNKNLGFGQTPPPPCWSKFPTFSKNQIWGLPLFGKTNKTSTPHSKSWFLNVIHSVPFPNCTPHMKILVSIWYESIFFIQGPEVLEPVFCRPWSNLALWSVSIASTFWSPSLASTLWSTSL